MFGAPLSVGSGFIPTFSFNEQDGCDEGGCEADSARNGQTAIAYDLIQCRNSCLCQGHHDDKRANIVPGRASEHAIKQQQATRADQSRDHDHGPICPRHRAAHVA